MPKKSGVEGKLPDPKDLTNTLEQIICDAMSEWQRRNVIPATRWKAPIYAGPDPREFYHPRNLLKQYIGAVNARTSRGREYVTCGIPGATGRASQTPQDRAWIIVQVLHRGWTNPSERSKPMRFAVWTSQLQNPNAATTPPEGIEEDPNITWIFVTYARPQSRITLNRFHADAFESQAGEFINILNKKLTDIKHIRQTKVGVLG